MSILNKIDPSIRTEKGKYSLHNVPLDKLSKEEKAKQSGLLLDAKLLSKQGGEMVNPDEASSFQTFKYHLFLLDASNKEANIPDSTDWYYDFGYICKVYKLNFFGFLRVLQRLEKFVDDRQLVSYRTYLHYILLHFWKRLQEYNQIQTGWFDERHHKMETLEQVKKMASYIRNLIWTLLQSKTLHDACQIMYEEGKASIGDNTCTTLVAKTESEKLQKRKCEQDRQRAKEDTCQVRKGCTAKKAFLIGSTNCHYSQYDALYINLFGTTKVTENNFDEKVVDRK